ncbi:hypothetical protein HanXRQr2_Chr07g0291171 [Helianthus annuus]|uniref:Uncharacterized protein n=1 Tax=Helianthus annuus TaxID=4232 RepID=A0A251UAF6_HELAN|nr:hypothetical protein HanXRQr2_Chr07g0291171 [Helianthus annuus]
MSKISPDPTMVWSVKVVKTRSTLQDQSIQPEVNPRFLQANLGFLYQSLQDPRFLSDESL